jgi:voltage-gated potassium channel
MATGVSSGTPGGMLSALYAALNPGENRSRASDAAKLILILAIAGSVFAATWGTIPGLSPSFDATLHTISQIAFIIFLIEYLARLASTPGRDPAALAKPAEAIWHYMCSPLGLVDALVVLPQLASLIDLLGADWARLGGVLALVKVARYARAIPLVTTVFRNEGRSLLAALNVMLVLLLIAATIMYMLEHNAQPQLFSSIPASLWWAIVTIATVGYGDMTPITIGGRIFAGITMLIGIAMFAVPAGILATGFAAEIRRRDFVVTWNTVAKVPLFSGLDAASIASIARLLKPEIAPAHYAIVRRGDPATAMYFIMSGEVEVDVHPNPVRLRAGQFFGEIALLRQTQRSATVTSVTEVQLLALEASDFRNLIDRYPDLKERVSQIAENRLGAKPEPPTPEGG